ncbi:TolC family protein [Chitinophaga sancti]|uniref:TolC family protein n=1 Tax=Chitinophaga sancti TaxID=1004 RepID=UPI002A750167|nr:TolC family protein [Chitinophaga sancti]WPQ62029.1 TolC family protein [Chitinophaga sancti]
MEQLIKIHLTIWLVCCSLCLSAQRHLSLEECTDIALKQSLQVKSDVLDLDKTSASIKQAYSALLPTIGINGAYQYSPQVQASVIPSETFGGTSGTFSAVKLGVPQTKSATAELNQNIYNPSAIIALKAAKVLLQGNKLQIKSSKEDLVYNVAATYYNIQSLLKQEEMTSQNLHNTQSLLDSTIAQFQAGLATQTDVDRLQVTHDNSEADLERLHNNKEKYYNLLKVLMNLPLNENILVNPIPENESPSLSTDNYNLAQKTNYLQILQNKQTAELEFKNIKSGYQPTISFFANYGVYGYYSNANPLNNINDKWYPTSTIGIKMKLTLFDGFNIKYQAKQKKIEISKLDVQAAQTLQQNQKEVADAMADLKSNMLTYQNQQRNLVLAQKVLADINLQYLSGIAKVSDVINATTDLQTAQNNFISAQINIKQAQISLKKAQGTLLPQSF